MHQKTNTVRNSFFTVILWILFAVFPAYGELKIESVTPNQGTVGKDLAVALTGTGFDENTSVFMYRDRILSSADIMLGTDIELSGSFALVPSFTNRLLQVMDVADPENPIIIGSVETSIYSNDVALSGSNAFVAGGVGESRNGLEVIDVSDPKNPASIGSLQIPNCKEKYSSIVNTVFIAATTAFIGACDTLQVADVSDPRSPVIIGFVSTPDNIAAMAVSGDTAIIICGDIMLGDKHNSLQIIDVSDPKNPFIVGTLETARNASAVALSGNFAFVANRGAGLLIADVSDPKNPVIAGSVEIIDAYDVTLSENLAFVADRSGSVQVVDISSPETPVIIGSVNTLDKPLGIVLSEEFAFMTAYLPTDREMEVLGSMQVWPVPAESSSVTVSSETDISLTLPAPLNAGRYSLKVLSGSSTYELPGAVLFAPDWNPISGGHSMTIRGDAYFNAEKIKTSGYEIAAFGPGGESDCRGKANITETGGKRTYQLNIASDTEGEEISFRIWDSSSGEVYRVKDTVIFEADADITYSLDAPLTIGSVYPARGISGQELPVTITGTGFDENTRVFVYPDRDIGSVKTPGPANGIALSGSTAFVAAGSAGLQAVDVSDPRTPVIIGSADTPGNARGVALSGDTAFVADESAGLQTVDVSDPMNPVIIGSVDIPDYAYGVAVSGSTAFVAAGSSGLQAVDVSDPHNPAVIGFVDIPDLPLALDIELSGNLAFLADYYNGVQVAVLDVSDPQHPAVIGSLDTPGVTYDAVLSGDIAFVTHALESFQVFDMSNPQHPAAIGSANIPFFARSISLYRDFAFVAGYNSGLQIADVSDPRNPVIINYADTPGVVRDIAFSDDFALLALSGNIHDWGGEGSLQVQPVPAKISSVTVSSETSISVTLPATASPGRYTLNAVNKTENYEYAGAVVFSDALPGDITGDRRVNLQDALAALKTLSGTPGQIREDYVSAGADINGDGKAGLAEVIYILRDAAGMK